LTLRGRALLEQADVVVYDYLVNPETLASLPPQVERRCVGGPTDRLDQTEINALLVELALGGRVVVRLKGGDPFVFGRGGEEADALVSAGVAFEVVPGVTAAIACAAYAGIPVTHRGFGSTLAFCTGHEATDKAESDVDYGALARMATVVFYMGARAMPHLARRLIDAGRAPTTPVALVRWATRPDQSTVETTLAACAEGSAPAVEPPMIALVGEVVSLRRRIGWYERRPLHGRRVVVTRSAGQQGPLAERLRELGAEVVPFPTLDFGPPTDPSALVSADERLSTFDWVLLTSANGVDRVLDALSSRGRDARAFGRARIACVGPATARRLAERGLVADLVPREAVAEALFEALDTETIAGRRFALFRAEVAREVLPERLRAAGGEVEVVAAYRTVAAPVDEAVRTRIAAAEIDVVTFTASSTVHHFLSRFSPDTQARLFAQVPAVCIGPVTARTARDAGFRVEAVADPYTVSGLLDALCGPEAFASTSRS
jgi:uroporphyrinogen III methyltransferase/synthase